VASKNRSDASKNEYDNVTDDEINYLERPLLINNEDKSDPDQLTTLLGIRMKQSTKKEIEIAILMIVVIILGSANRVANKIMTQPFGNYSFFTTLFGAALYVALYFTILLVRYGMKIVTKDMLSYPWKKMPSTSTNCFVRTWEVIPPIKYFILMGLMDGLGNILGIIPTPYISGPMISLMSQTIVLFSMIAALIMLGTRYTYWQTWSVLVVVMGALVAIIPDITGHSKTHSSLGYSILMAVSTIPSAISFTLKELVFKNKKGLDVFIVNSHGSLFQLLWWPVMIPITLIFNQTKGVPLWDYVRDGFRCFFGMTPEGATSDCTPNPWPYLIYMVINLLFNITLLVLLKKASALQSFMALKAILPISVFLFYFDWPLIGSDNINQFTIYGLIVVMAGLIAYRYTTFVKEKNQKQSSCFSVYLPWCRSATSGYRPI
jgi:hypothetical protein